MRSYINLFILFSGFLGPGANWLIQILNDLIFTTIQTKPVSTELPFIECGDPDKYQVSEKNLLNHLQSVVFFLSRTPACKLLK